MNETLALWERQASKKGVFLADSILIEKAKRIGASLDLPADFNYSQHNWLAAWKKKVKLLPLVSCACVVFFLCVAINLRVWHPVFAALVIYE